MSRFDNIGDSTVQSRSQADGAATGGASAPALTILWHPDLSRVGERVVLRELLPEGHVSVTRLAPGFGRPGTTDDQPLADARLSRSQPALELAVSARAGLEISAGSIEVDVHGARLDKSAMIAPSELEQGVIITLANRIVLCLHRARVPSARGPNLGLIGGGDGLERVREDIARVADLDIPVLIRGESGTGKELVARGIVAAGKRGGKPLIAVNLAAVPASTAAAELFGHEKGAFTGAGAARSGYFGEAAGGTLFLDEIGLAPMELQQALLRVLETGEYFPVGASRSRKSDVRILAATDVDLEASMTARDFFLPLFQRLAGFQLVVPPLRARREDLGDLLLHFLREELASVNELHRLDPGSDAPKPWLGAADVARIAVGSWPGNVRALRNAVRQIVIASRGRPFAVVGAEVDRLADPSVGLAPGPLPPPRRPLDGRKDEAASPKVAPWEISREVLLEALARNGNSYTATAAALGIPRTTLNSLLDKHQIKRASSLSDTELMAEYEAVGGDLDALADRLKMSRRALRLKMATLLPGKRTPEEG